jgi:putative lipoprotein
MGPRRCGALLAALALLGTAGAGWADDAGAEAGEPVSLRDLGGSNWRVEDIQGSGVVDRTLSSLGFRGDGIVGSGGCNRFQGGVAVEEGRLVVGPLAVTRRACPAAVMDQEQRYLAALGQAARLERHGPRLHVLDADGARLLRLAPLDDDA